MTRQIVRTFVTVKKEVREIPTAHRSFVKSVIRLFGTSRYASRWRIPPGDIECGIVRPSIHGLVTSMHRRALLKLAALSSVGLAGTQATVQPNPSIHNSERITMDDIIVIGGSRDAIPRSGWSVRGPTASPVPSTILRPDWR